MCNKEIRIFVKKSYGNERFYPNCEESKFFLELTGKKCFNIENIKTILRKGYRVTYEGDSSDDLKELNIQRI